MRAQSNAACRRAMQESALTTSSAPGRGVSRKGKPPKPLQTIPAVQSAPQRPNLLATFPHPRSLSRRWWTSAFLPANDQCG